MIIPVYKPQGLTPLEAVTKFKQIFPEHEDVPLTYAGRLDPMAEGLLLLLSGADIRNKEKFLALNKTYVTEILLGFQTDSFDLLGIAKQVSLTNPSEAEVKTKIAELAGTKTLPLPPYSSRPVEGKPLFMWAREGRLSEIIIPTHEATVFKSEFLSSREIDGETLLEIITDKIKRTSGDFRQKLAIDSWTQVLIPEKNYPLYKFSVTVTSGTYIRALVQNLGETLNCGACLFSLTRTSIDLFQASTAKQI